MFKFFLGVIVGGVLAVTVSQAADTFVQLADYLPEEVRSALLELEGV